MFDFWITLSCDITLSIFCDCFELTEYNALFYNINSLSEEKYLVSVFDNLEDIESIELYELNKITDEEFLTELYVKGGDKIVKFPKDFYN